MSSVDVMMTSTFCLWTEGSQKSRSEAEAQRYCEEKQGNSFLPRITNSDIQNKLADFRSADHNGDLLLGNSGFWIDVSATAINNFHWIDGSSLTGHFIYEFAGIIALLLVQYENNNTNNTTARNVSSLFTVLVKILISIK